MIPEQYKKKLAKMQEAADRKKLRLEKRLRLQLTKAKQPKLALLKKTLRIITHKIVRLQGFKCYTCDKPLEYRDRQAGHFWTDGGHSKTRYDFDNIRVQCTSCNLHKSGNGAEFSIRLLNELSYGQFQALANRANQIHKWNREELLHLIETRQEILNQLNKQNE